MVYISTMLYAFLRPSQAIQRLHDHGFTSIELSYDNFNYFVKHGEQLDTLMKEVVDVTGTLNLNMNVAHLPYGEEIRLAVELDKMTRVINIFNTWLKFYSDIGINLAAIHIPFNNPHIDEGSIEYTSRIRDRAMLFFEKILYHSENYGIRLSIENRLERGVYGYLPNDLLYLINSIGSDKFGVCLDTGHAIVNGFQPSEFYVKLAKYVNLIHAHDNDGYRDLHLPPLSTGTIHWDELFRALSMNGFEGKIVLEVACHKESLTDCDNIAKLLKLIARYFEELLNSRA
ncbi:MAG: sugar phosphate isomerase/epimerase [Ignisphaera sp.]|nr:sugar phosphate isomerase/epimerase [Ignisphaera sp.]MCX8168205.1 sugar phosphate isomerase/epimerase [Ignisphaera sp.]MDW8084925.1 sugar phosphate isomerase/epimerase [Ignisphaera sp.]